MTPDLKTVLRRGIGILILLTIVGLATCQSLINSFSSGLASSAATNTLRN